MYKYSDMSYEFVDQDYGNKRTTLYDIRDELFAPYCDKRPPFSSMSLEDKFTLLAGETPDSFYEGKLITCTVVGIVRHKPSRDVLDRANPNKNQKTGYWQCPFCLRADFPDLSLVSATLVLQHNYNIHTYYVWYWSNVELVCIACND